MPHHLTHEQVCQYDEVQDEEAGAADDDGEAHGGARPPPPLMLHHRAVGQLAGALCRPARTHAGGQGNGRGLRAEGWKVASEK